MDTERAHGVIVVLGSPNHKIGRLSLNRTRTPREAARGTHPSAYVSLLTEASAHTSARMTAEVVPRVDPNEVVVVTSHFHLPRARYILDRVLERKIRYMGVPHAGDAGVRVELARHEAEALRREKAKME